MGLYTQTVKGIHWAPYRDQVVVELLRRSLDINLTSAEEAKIERVRRFLPAYDCANEIEAGREKAK